ncbi:MAG: T9SS type A sorting domain-containing protein [Salibacteraceae bacterium]
MRYLFIIIIGLSINIAYAQVFTLDTTYYVGAPHTGELILANGYKYIGTDGSLARYRLNNSSNWGYGIGSPNNCLHDNSRFKDLELLSNGSLAGIFYHDESCITPESAFVMLDSNGNVLVDKRFAKGLSLHSAGIIEKDSLVHVYAFHILPAPIYGGLTHYTFNLSGKQLDSNNRFPINTYGSLSAFDGSLDQGDSLFVPITYYSNGAFLNTVSKTDINLAINSPILYRDSLNHIQRMRVYDNKIALALRKINFGGYRAAFGLVNTDGSNVRVDTSILGPSIEYGDVIKMKDYYVVTEYSPIPGNAYHNLIIYDSTLNIVNRQPVSHKGGLFIKTSDSTFVLYDETWTYQYTMNFDSIPGYVTGTDEYINKPVAELDVKIYPNPTTGHLNIEGEGITKVEIFNMQGKLLLSQPHKFQLNLGFLSNGLYHIRLTTPTGFYYESISKM